MFKQYPPSATPQTITVILILTLFVLVLGSMAVVLYTDAYVVVRGFDSQDLYYYETIYKCCGINGPQDYGNISSDSIPLSCYKNRKADKPQNLYTRGCLLVSTNNWFWFVFSNCYPLVFILIVVDFYLHVKLRRF